VFILAEKEYTFNQQVILETIKSTYGLPTIALSALAATGVFAGLKFLDFLSAVTLPKLPKLPSIPTTTDILDKLKVGIVGPEVIRFANDGQACARAYPQQLSFLGQKYDDPLRGAKIAACMVRKGWADDVVLQWLRSLI